MIARANEDGSLVITDPSDAGTIYGKGYFGTLTEVGLSLDPYESVYLVEMSRLDAASAAGRSLDWTTLFRRASRHHSEFGIRYVVYRDLRQRGYVVRASPPPVAFAVLPRGGILHKTPAKFWVQPYSERFPFRLSELVDLAQRAQGAKKNLLLALVDEESDLTYYRVRRPAPSGALPPATRGSKAVGWLTADRVVVFETAAVEGLGASLAYGSRIGRRLELSLLEAAYLTEAGVLELRDVRTHRKVPVERVVSRARKVDSRFDERLAAYRALRARHLVVKTGFKYGAHFRAYPRNPEHSHARYLVQAVPADHVASWPDVAGGVRVAQGVRKEFLLGGVSDDGSVGFLSLERIRP